MIFETQCTSMVTHFMSTVHVHATFVLSTEPSGSVLKVNLPFISPFSISFNFRFSVHRVFPEPASSSSDSLSYSSATLWIKTTGATDSRKSYNAHFFFVKYRALIVH